MSPLSRLQAEHTGTGHQTLNLVRRNKKFSKCDQMLLYSVIRGFIIFHTYWHLKLGFSLAPALCCALPLHKIVRYIGVRSPCAM